MTVKKRLVGVGVGPGDPELVTLRAARILAEADVVVCPDAKLGRAETIVREVAPQAEILRIEFSMSRDLGEREKSRREAAEAVAQRFASGAQLIAFATIGDPNVYSTFSYVAEFMPVGVASETVPGITAMQLFAAEQNRPLVLGDEILALAPATAGADRLREAREAADVVVVYKAGRQVQMVAEVFAGHDLAVGSNLGTEDSRISTDPSQSGQLGYFSTVLARRKP
ncbi:precorrin-2 C(20)-methyltransferase [Tessaracoccus massiliensis]|uniref:precorrin-2 C(20)-methyltransferase n=1 Tax=Tessaracoccus massiliensis TaxID=1522311 RepID=UPI00058FD560|nr:precorrin-2 C(20)-methyltransferase [Tessaracoccus massiliensis]